MKKENNNSKLVVLYSLIILIISLAIFLCNPNFNTSKSSKEKYPEITYLTNHKLNFDQLKAYFKEISRSKNAIYAFEVLARSPLSYGIDTHLLAHTVGDELYKEKGINGMKYCTDDFRNACSHSLVINLFYEKGEAGLVEINSACQQTTSAAAYGMCYHGLGHGVFAYSGYNFPKTIELCKKTLPDNPSGPEFKECIGGAVMEQVSGGDHDKKTWSAMRFRNLSYENPLNICLDQIITDQEARKMCLIYLTPYLWEIEGRISLNISDDILVRSFDHCDKIPMSDGEYRKSCFGGFGKEFVAMAKGKDIRHIDKLTDQEMQKIYRWCLLSLSQDGQKYCVVHAQGSLYWSGSNDKKLPAHFCSLAPTNELQNYCYEGLIGAIKAGDKKNRNYLEEFCREIPEQLKIECRKQLSLDI